MPRLARIVAPGIPHHITQRGNRKQQVFFSDRDRRTYLDLIRTFSELYGVKIWAYCLMDNHVHFVAVPEGKESLIRCFQEVHRAYTRAVNLREGWSGYLWQGRFASFPMDESHLLAAMRYVECNPVQAHLVERAQDYPWSSARAHVSGIADPVLSPCFLLETVKDWDSFLRDANSQMQRTMETSLRSGRPLGSERFVQGLEKLLNREIHKKKPGPKKKVLAVSNSSDMSLPLV